MVLRRPSGSPEPMGRRDHPSPRYHQEQELEDLVGSVLGWLGTIGTFSAYVLIWRGWAAPTTKRYAALNAFGGLLASAGALAYGAWPAVASNLVWGIIGLQGLIIATRRARAARQTWKPLPEEFDAGIADTVPITLPVLQELRELQKQVVLTPR